jgi:benzoylformate decarboxylase
MRELVHQFLGNGLTRRGFLQRMTALGFTAASAEAILKPLEASESPSASDAGATSVEGTGADLVIAQARAAGARYLFTNPGSLEVGFFDAFYDTPEMQLVMGLHEGIVISMADGYNKVSGESSFVNVHAIAGTAQASGQIYNASRDGSSMVITAGLGDNERWSDDFILQPRPGFNQKEVNRQFTKFSWEGRESRSLALMVRRAFKVAATEPGGPVYLALANYALAGQAKGDILPKERFILRGRTRADEGALEETAKLLVEAKRPLLVVGDGVWRSGAQDALLQLSDSLGVPVATMRWPAFANVPSHYHHNIGRFDMRSEFIQGVDLILSVGARDFGTSSPPEGPTVPAGATIVRIGLDTDAMSRTNATDIALVADIKETLEDLTEAATSRISKERLASLASSRSEPARTIAAARIAAIEEETQKNLGQSPIHPDELGAVFARSVDDDAIVLSENLTGRYGNFHFGHRDGEKMYMHCSGHALGWGIGASMGAKIGDPDRQVVCSIGDGAVMYSASGFWTQARYGIPVLTVVWNNRNYQTVRGAFYRYGGKMAKDDHYPGMYLGDPDIDFVGLAKSQGISAERVESGADLEAAFRRGTAATRAGTPYLIEVVVARYGGGASSTWHQEFNLAEKRARKV